jgi:hypothetical protein
MCSIVDGLKGRGGLRAIMSVRESDNRGRLRYLQARQRERVTKIVSLTEIVANSLIVGK